MLLSLDAHRATPELDVFRGAPVWRDPMVTHADDLKRRDGRESVRPELLDDSSLCSASVPQRRPGRRPCSRRTVASPPSPLHR